MDPSFAEAALVFCDDEDAVDVLHPVEVERPAAVDPVAVGGDPIAVEDGRALVEVPVGGLGGAAVQALGNLVAVFGHGSDLTHRYVKGGKETEIWKFVNYNKKEKNVEENEDEDESWLHFVQEEGCWSWIGKRQGEQWLSLGQGCTKQSTVNKSLFYWNLSINSYLFPIFRSFTRLYMHLAFGMSNHD